jgi:hypothetical protein
MANQLSESDRFKAQSINSRLSSITAQGVTKTGTVPFGELARNSGAFSRNTISRSSTFKPDAKIASRARIA